LGLNGLVNVSPPEPNHYSLGRMPMLIETQHFVSCR
jgi:hypothetical protein